MAYLMGQHPNRLAAIQGMQQPIGYGNRGIPPMSHRKGIGQTARNIVKPWFCREIGTPAQFGYNGMENRCLPSLQPGCTVHAHDQLGSRHRVEQQQHAQHQQQKETRRTPQNPTQHRQKSAHDQQQQQGLQPVRQGVPLPYIGVHR